MTSRYWPGSVIWSLAVIVNACAGPVEAALGLLGIGANEYGAHVFEPEAISRQALRIDLDAYRRLLVALHADPAHARDLAQLLGKHAVGGIADAHDRQRVRREGKG